ncbi:MULTISPECIES: O-methyltransferase [Prauserella salsuginis group]|uniref:O-methyltransferase n=1 Tax=Prauserella salsuginis TaxID=387889 RepID=A0ABW6G4X3_9PSEU|nr:MULTISPECIES: O-methyltransferase [Prauserella salsuginis group]MCR3718792.1 putative O-methyltransferase YrrM [Prauserella flava]MCR3733362.1 putative O-methyltransferase YrrM [Prauserella salsuginis]
MDPRTWATVDDYLTDNLLGSDEALDGAARAAAEAGLPDIAVSAPQGRFLTLLAGMVGARSILEVGTLGGYSAICLARALPPEGTLITLEADPRFADVARGNVDRAGVGDRIDIRVGTALDTLPTLHDEAPFDLVFLDADKGNNANYFRWALELSRPGTVIVVDNVVRGGAVADAASDDPGVRGTRHMFELMATEPRVDATALQTVADKGYDGFALALVTG